MARSTWTRLLGWVDWQIEQGTPRNLGWRLVPASRREEADRRAGRRHARRRRGGIDDRVPFLPGTGSCSGWIETLELTAEVAAPRRGGRARRDSVLQRAAAGRPVRLVRAGRAGSYPTCRSSSTTSRSARPSIYRSGHGRQASPRVRQCRWHQGDDEGLRARLVCPRRVRHVTSSRSPGIEAALLPDAHARWPRPPQLCGELRPATRGGALRRLRCGRRRDRAGALHYQLHPLVDAAFAETNPVPAKWIMG